MGATGDHSCGVVVVGGGIVGLSVAEQLARRGRSVICLEQGVPGQGQSAGQTRIFRHAHADPRLTTLALRARSAWRDLGGRVGEVLVGDEGVAIVGAAEDEAERLGDLGVVVTTLDEDELRSYLPMGAGDHAPRSAVLDLDAGAIRVDSAVRGLCALLGESLVRARVLGITERATSVEIMTTEGVLSCEEVVVAAGTETPVLVSSLGLPVLQERLCHVRVVFSVKDGLGLPCMLDRTGLYGEVAYASPLPNGSAYAIGLSGPDNSLPTDMNGALLGASGVVELERRIVRYAETALPQAVGAKVSTRLCLSTPLPSHDDAIAIWGQGRVRAIAGNNMFKFAPLLGVVLADALEGQEVPEVLLPGVAGADV